MKHSFTLCTLILLLAITMQAQKKRVLFIGNSYTYENNLPQLLAGIAASTGDTVIYDSSTPGGYTFMGHCGNATTLSKIAAGNWDVVVLQEQSQLPSFPMAQVNSQVLPYAKRLDSLVKVHNPCAETMFYMTWGRKNGDASNCGNWPPVCSYKGMDSLLQLRYRLMALNNKALVSPVGAVWRFIRQNHPGIELYQPDESHPSVAGSYAAACSFYTAIFRKNPMLITANGGLQPQDAANIRAAARLVVYDSLKTWHIGEYDPQAAFSFQLAGSLANFTNTSQGAATYTWSFGDNGFSFQTNPQHSYSQSGNYTVTLIASRCGRNDTSSAVISVISTGARAIAGAVSPQLFPQPAGSQLFVKLNHYPISYHLISAGAGRLKSGELGAENEAIGLQGLAPGIYFLELTDARNQQYRLRFIRHSD